METARVVFGLWAAVLVPWDLGLQRSRPLLAMLCTLAYGALAVAPYVDEVRPEAGLTGATLLTLGQGLLHRTTPIPGIGFSITMPLFSGAVARTRWLGAAVLAGAALLLLGAAGPGVASLGADLLANDRAWVLLSAFLISVFGGGSLAKAATGPVRREIAALPLGPQRDAAMEFMSGSRAIGLLERGLLFCFFAAGQPEAAALVLAAKSLARVPTADHGKHASEYFLIGTLASVIASSAMSMAARSALGLPAF